MTILRIILPIEQETLANGGPSRFEPLLLCLGLIVSMAWALAVAIPIIAVAAFANAFAWAQGYLQQPASNQLVAETRQIKHPDADGALGSASPHLRRLCPQLRGRTAFRRARH
jgi:hypothetical protein